MLSEQTEPGGLSAELSSYNYLGETSESESSLIVGTENDPYPSGTKLFASIYHLDRKTCKKLALAVSFPLFCFLFAACIGRKTHGKRVANAWFLAFSFFSFFGILFFTRYVFIKDGQRYQKEVAEGTWKEGVFVLSNGDLVIRLDKIFTLVEKIISRDSISHALGKN
mmetsp:Transcript_6160/g.7473  ORF Transcript_6160/g.7473 Transcript_6160/m.7473 type:complete len:167 (-) Transcript_6160:91-591(-)